MPTSAILFTVFAGDDVPDWVRLMPLGVFRPHLESDRRGPFNLADVQAVIAATASHLPLMVDEDHVSLAPFAPAPARGWIVELQARADGLYGRIEWTETGRALMAERAYRGFSPTFTSGKGGVVEQIISLALTNTPALPELNRFKTERNHDVDFIVALRQALGLPDTADEAAILAGAKANVAALRECTVGLDGLAAAADVAAGAGRQALFSALRVRVAGTGDVAALTAQVQSLETSLAAMRADTARSNAERFVDEQIKAGKPVNALREHYVKRHMADPTSVEAELAALPSINTGGMPPPKGGEGGGGDTAALTAVEREVIAHMGVSEKSYLAEKVRLAALAAQRQGAGGVH